MKIASRAWESGLSPDSLMMKTEFVLVVLIPRSHCSCWQVSGERIGIGRGKGNHLDLNDPAISHFHAELILSPMADQWTFRDLGSTNGSTLNGLKVGWEALPVSEGDELILGKAVRIFLVSVRSLVEPEPVEEEDPDVNPVAATVARQIRHEMEGTQLIRLPPLPGREKKE